MDTKKKTFEPDTLNEYLMQGLKFSSKDLDANRDGWLTFGQQKRIRESQFEDAIAVAVVTLLTVGLIFLAVNANHPVTSTQCWGMMAIILPVALILFWYQHRTLQVVKRGKVIPTQGPVKREQVSDRGAHRYTVSTLYKRFSVVEDVYNAFVEGDTYTLYYVPELDTLISAEHHISINSEARTSKERRRHNIQKREPVTQSPVLTYWPSKKTATPLLPQHSTPRQAAFRHAADHVTSYKSQPRHQTQHSSSSRTRIARPRTKH